MITNIGTSVKILGMQEIEDDISALVRRKYKLANEFRFKFNKKN